MNTASNNTIDLRPYLPSPKQHKIKLTYRNIIECIGLVIEGAVTLGIGICLMTGIYVFLTIL